MKLHITYAYILQRYEEAGGTKNPGLAARVVVTTSIRASHYEIQ